MRLLISSLFFKSPFEDLQKHADKIKECAHLFREAVVCNMGQECKRFDLLTEQVARMESEVPVDKFQFFQYLREQDKVMDEVEEALFWLSFRPEGIPTELATDIHHLVEAVIQPIEKLPVLVTLATDYFKSKSTEQRNKMKSLIRDIRQRCTGSISSGQAGRAYRRHCRSCAECLGPNAGYDCRIISFAPPT
ncbi:MAG: DUF47 family protein [Deltaproteobacteria bacterium]|nr:DUF47 family protein [Deltaproteobacteria bacterium]